MRPEKIVKSQHEIMIGNGTDSILCLTHCINTCFKKAVETKQDNIEKALEIKNWFCILLQANVDKKNWMNTCLHSVKEPGTSYITSLFLQCRDLASLKSCQQLQYFCRKFAIFQHGPETEIPMVFPNWYINSVKTT